MQKHLLLLLAGSIISAILHNFISGLLKTNVWVSYLLLLLAPVLAVMLREKGE